MIKAEEQRTSDLKSFPVYKSVKNKKWTKLSVDENLVNAIKNNSNIPHIIAELLARKNIHPGKIDDFLNPKLKKFLPELDKLMDIDKAVDLTIAALKEKKKITIFGDYDVDGATSSALIKRCLTFLGMEEVEIYIPDRTLEGYGLNLEAMDKIRNYGTELLITVDCGSSSHEAIEKANALGMKVIVIDHHLCGENLPDAVVVNPSRLDDSSNLNYLAAVGVSFLFVIAVTKKAVELEIVKPVEIPDLLLLLDLVALGTVCDMMPLMGLNRIFVKQGLKVIEAQNNLGIKALLETSRVPVGSTNISTYHLGFVLGPKINASGRVGQSHLGSELLSCEDYKKCLDIAMRLEMYNHERKIIENKTLNEAIAEAAFVGKDVPFTCVDGEDWHHGVIGIVAERLKEKFGKPSFVISIDKEGLGKASCRSIKGIDIGQTILEAKKIGLLEAGGGHAMAAGFTVKQNKIDDLKSFFNEQFKEPYKAIMENGVNFYDNVLSIESITIDLVRQINKIGPFGIGNEQPKFMLSSVSIVHPSLVRGEHVSCVLKDFSNPDSNKTIRGICFRGTQSSIGEILLSKRPNLNLIATLSLNRWQNQERVEIIILDAILSGF
ncbi:MAG: single-stranded-DNA-specific exonuclease RecJ [Rickettsiales bacterium]|nr:single-stranded-DNA-specific exonuclease RecJ [Rickettsiales bacterium]